MGINNEGVCYMSFDAFNNADYSSISDSNKYHIKFFLIGDLKGLFQIVGRSSFDSSYCLYYDYRPKTWKFIFFCKTSSSSSNKLLNLFSRTKPRFVIILESF